MQLIDFDFFLPSELIAQYPIKNRTDSRLLKLTKSTGHITHHIFKEIPTFLKKGDLLVFNDTRVIPARLFAHKQTGGKVEILLERCLDTQRILAHVKSSKSLKTGVALQVNSTVFLTVVQRHQDVWELSYMGEKTILEIFKLYGHVPLPPYIHRSDEDLDQERYQTVYARQDGAVAAPTAGLHFDHSLLERLQAQGIQLGFVTLHVGSGTFQPIRCDNIREHNMHAESIEVSKALCEQVAKVKQAGGNIIAVGTTSVRALESAASTGTLLPTCTDTRIFIYPGYRFKVVDKLITNFHLPKSTLIMLVSAFGGHENVMRAYKEAIDKQYRFFSYGDAMLIE